MILSQYDLIVILLVFFFKCPNEAYNFLRESVSYKCDLNNSTLVSPNKLCTLKGKSNSPSYYFFISHFFSSKIHPAIHAKFI